MSVDPQIVVADGMSTSTITVKLVGPDNQPVAGERVSLSSSRGALDTIVPPTGPTDASGIVTATISSTTPGISTITATVVSTGLVLEDSPQVFFTQGQVLRLNKGASKSKAVVGDVVTYRVQLRNTTARDVVSVQVRAP